MGEQQENEAFYHRSLSAMNCDYPQGHSLPFRASSMCCLKGLRVQRESLRSLGLGETGVLNCLTQVLCALTGQMV